MSEERKIKITVEKVFKPEDVFTVSPFPEMTLGPCEKHQEGQVFYYTQAEGISPGFCSSAWASVFPFILVLIYGGDFHSFYKQSGVGVFACSDGLRPVIFRIELE